jgi:methylated-DNA-[protein]-cysteine S-methyltransferase
MQYHLFDTAIGICGIGWNERGVLRFQLPDTETGQTEKKLMARVPHGRDAQCTDQLPEPIRDAVAQLLRYFAGAQPDFSGIAVDLGQVGEFRRNIYEQLRKVGWGTTVTYGDLAKRIGAGPEAAREVGQAMGSNPVPVIIPCHRVLAAGNRIGGFSAPGGTVTKERLLALEGVQVGEPVLPGLFN